MSKVYTFQLPKYVKSVQITVTDTEVIIDQTKEKGVVLEQAQHVSIISSSDMNVQMVKQQLIDLENKNEVLKRALSELLMRQVATLGGMVAVLPHRTHQISEMIQELSKKIV